MIGALIIALVEQRPKRPFPWLVLGGGLFTILVANAVWYPSLTGATAALPFPSFADALFIAGYLGYLGGVLLLARQGNDSRRRESVLDTLIVTGGFAVMYWQFLIEPELHGSTSPILTLSVALAYPVLDLLLLGGGIWLMVSRRERPPALWLLLSAVAVLLGNDTAFGLMTLKGLSLDNSLFLSVYPLSFVLLGAAFLHPSMRSFMIGGSTSSRDASVPRLAMVGAASLVAPVTLLGSGETATLHFRVMAVLAICLSVLVLIRLGGVIRRLHRVEVERRYALAGTLRAVETERTKIASDIHDGPIQSLTALGYVLDRACLRLRRECGETSAELIGRLRGGFSEEIENLRQLMTRLRPAALDERGIESALRDFADALFQGTSTACSMQIDETKTVPSELQTTLFRISQEALRNVARHADASQARVSLRNRDDLIVLHVEDNGRGFDPVKAAARVEDMRSYGLTAMNAKVEMAGGTFRVDSGHGFTVVEARIPMEVK
jgi:signal transduction histidine kinase